MSGGRLTIDAAPSKPESIMTYNGCILFTNKAYRAAAKNKSGNGGMQRDCRDQSVGRGKPVRTIENKNGNDGTEPVKKRI